MIVSGNDAAIAIATHIGKKSRAVCKIMNKKAKDIGMSNTHFVNPHGLPIQDLHKILRLNQKQNISTARDIATLVSICLIIMKNKLHQLLIWLPIQIQIEDLKKQH
ncbi:hypothetical protein Q5M85_13615 [Paraclostridium bifermentans]|nr:hypothetical protein [Paraclostridium bifermentans]